MDPADIEIDIQHRDLCGAQVHVWVIGLYPDDACTHEDEPILSSDEISRASRYHFQGDRRRFIVARSAVRKILSRYIGTAPEALTFSYGSEGKPELSQEHHSCRIKFNLSHSKNQALLSISDGLRIGVDLEAVDQTFATEAVAKSFLSINEFRHFLNTPSFDRADALFASWTRKEAYIKAVGKGVSIPLSSIEVPFGVELTSALIQHPQCRSGGSGWTIYDIECPTKAFRAALVVEGRGHILRRFRWPVRKPINRPW